MWDSVQNVGSSQTYDGICTSLSSSAVRNAARDSSSVLNEMKLGTKRCTMRSEKMLSAPIISRHHWATYPFQAVRVLQSHTVVIATLPARNSQNSRWGGLVGWRTVGEDNRRFGRGYMGTSVTSGSWTGAWQELGRNSCKPSSCGRRVGLWGGARRRGEALCDVQMCIYIYRRRHACLPAHCCVRVWRSIAALQLLLFARGCDFW